MKKSFLIIVLLIGIFSLKSQAQNDIDAFRFSQLDWSGTARFVGVGGAFGAVGAEFSALATNPASIGVYKKSEFSFTPLVVSIINSSSIYNTSQSKYLSSNYNLSNIGIILVFPTRENSPWKGLQFGFGYNRIADFNNQFRIEGMSKNSSLMDEFVYYANQSNDELSVTGPFDTDLAWNTWLLDFDSVQNSYYSPLEKSVLRQSKYVHTSGAIDEMNVSFGANYSDKVYVGATLGIPFISYTEKSTYSEFDDLDTIGGFVSYDMDDYLSTRGTGINLKVGVLYQPADFVRLGVAFHTPTFYNELKDTYSRAITAENTSQNYAKESPVQSYKYMLTTPLRIIGDVAFFIKKRAFVSAEYELVDYGSAALFARDYSFIRENQDIRDKYGLQHSIRIGGEVSLQEYFSVRVGYNYKTTPYKNKINDGSSHIVSTGLGFRSQNFFIDLAYVLKMTKEQYWLYSPNFVNEANNEYLFHRIVLTGGLKF